MLESTDTTDLTETGTPILTETSDMIGVHNVFRDAFAAAPRLVGSDVDADRADTVAIYYDVVLRLLQAHHEGEDELLIPLLTRRCRGEDLATVTRVAAQHGPVAELIGTARQRLADWRRTPGAGSGADLRSALKAAQRELLPHLDDEEREVLPIAARAVTPEEWGQMPGHAMRQFDGRDLWLVLGLVFDHMTDEQRTVAQAHMPPPLLSAWAEQGRAQYEGFAARLHG